MNQDNLPNPDPSIFIADLEDFKLSCCIWCFGSHHLKIEDNNENSHNTTRPRSLTHDTYLGSYYIKWLKTSWT